MTRSTNVTPSPALPASPTTSERSDVYPKFPLEKLQHVPSPTPPPSPTESSASGTTSAIIRCEASRKNSTSYRAPKTVVLEDEKPCCSHSLHNETNKNEGQSFDVQQELKVEDDSVQSKDKNNSTIVVEECQCEVNDCVQYQQTEYDNDDEPETDLDKDVPFTYCPDCHHFDDKDMGRIATTSIEDAANCTDSPNQPSSATPTTDKCSLAARCHVKSRRNLMMVKMMVV